MNIVDALIKLLCYTVQNLLVPRLASDAPLYPIVNFKADLLSIKSFFINAFSGLGFIFPMDLLLKLFDTIIIMELALFGFKIIKYAVNLIRGSGA